MSVVEPGPRYLARPFDPAAGLRAVSAFVAFGVGVSALYAGTGIGAPCPFRAITGWWCPLCGGTRLGAALFHLDFARAWALNPLVFIGLALLPLLAVIWTVELLGGPALRPPARLAGRLRRVHPTRWLVLGVAVAVGYTVLRNLI